MQTKFALAFVDVCLAVSSCEAVHTNAGVGGPEVQAGPSILTGLTLTHIDASGAVSAGESRCTCAGVVVDQVVTCAPIQTEIGKTVVDVDLAS